MRPLGATVRVASCLLAASLGVSACGLASRGGKAGGVTLTVTRDFGRTTVTRGEAPMRNGHFTALDLLESGASVTTGVHGTIVSINGLRAASPNHWSYWVNGSQPGVSAGSYKLTQGDVVQFDYGRSGSATTIVGAYPNPFVLGPNGKRLPVHVECESDSSAACQQVRTRLLAAGIVPAAATLGSLSGSDTLRIVVARLPAVRSLVTTSALELWPHASGVYARFGASGTRIDLLGPDGRTVRAAAPGSGLVAALSPPGNALVWVVTGLDDAGVARAAEALDASALANAFAVAAEPSGIVRLPLP